MIFHLLTQHFLIVVVDVIALIFSALTLIYATKLYNHTKIRKLLWFVAAYFITTFLIRGLTTLRDFEILNIEPTITMALAMITYPCVFLGIYYLYKVAKDIIPEGL